MATVTQIVCLDKEELEWVADHLGHNIEIHREFYRLQENVLEMSKVSKLLMTIESGSVHKVAGKRLSDISLEECFGNSQVAECDSESGLFSQLGEREKMIRVM